MKKQLIIISAFIAVGVSLHAEEFFQASLTPDIAIYSRTTEINGLALSIWGENPQHALALGFVNGSTGDSGGFSLSLVNYADSYAGVAWASSTSTKTSSLAGNAASSTFPKAHFQACNPAGLMSRRIIPASNWAL